MSEFILGVIASLVATALIFTSRNFWFSSWDKFLSKVYPKVTGVYEVVLGNEHLQKLWFPDERCTLEINQRGKKLYGFYKVYDGNNLKMTFAASGFVTADKVVVINYENTDGNTKGAGSFVLTILGVQKTLKGEVVYVCSECDDVHTFPCNLVKNES